MPQFNLFLNPNQKLTFQKILTPTFIEFDATDNIILRYSVRQDHGVTGDRGVYVVTVDGVPVYCGKYTRTFNRRWLYTKHNHIYHFKKKQIADSIKAGCSVCVYAQTEDNLKNQIGIDSDWVDVNSIESNILKKIPLAWNLISN